MATIVNNPGPERVIERDSGTSAAGWIVAVLLLVALIAAGAYAWSRYRGGTPSPSTNINVEIPNPVTNGTPGTQ